MTLSPPGSKHHVGTHAIGEDEKRVAAEFDEILRADVSKAEKAFEGSERFAVQ